MHPVYYSCFFLLLVLYLQRKKEKKIYIQNLIKRKRKGKNPMKELATKMLGKDCIVYTFNGEQIVGTVKEVTEGALWIANEKRSEIVNLDFVVRLREHPTNKDGKKKSVVLD